MIKKILLIFFILLYQNSLYSKTNENINFNLEILIKLFFLPCYRLTIKKMTELLKFFNFNKRLISEVKIHLKIYFIFIKRGKKLKKL